MILNHVGLGTREVYRWNLSNFTCDLVFNDDGCVNGTSIAVSANHEFVACGSDMGVVNVYRRSELDSRSRNPQPLKAVMNLTTFVDAATFHPSNEILAINSRTLQNALKLVHLPTGRVFKNWPTQTTPLRHVESLAFSRDGVYMAVGNDKGKVLLYQFTHFVQ